MTETKNLKLKTYETTTDGQELVARYIDNTSDNFQKIDEFCKTDTTLSVEGGIADAKTVGDNVSQLKDDLLNLDGYVFNRTDIRGKIERNYTTGQYEFETQKIHLPAGDYVLYIYDAKFSSVGYVNVQLTAHGSKIAEINAKGNVNFTLSEESDVYLVMQISLASNVPSDTYFVDYVIYKQGVVFSTDDILNYVDNVKVANKEIVNYKELGVNIFSVSGYVGLDGEIKNNANYSCTDYLYVNTDHDIVLNACKSGNEYMSLIAFYDANKKFIDKLSNVASTQNANYTVSKNLIPPKTAFIRVSGKTSNSFIDYKLNVLDSFNNTVRNQIAIREIDSKADSIKSAISPSKYACFSKNQVVSSYDYLSLPEVKVKKNSMLVARINGTIGNVSVGVGYVSSASSKRTYDARWITITSTEVNVYAYYNSSNELKATYQHGLSLTNKTTVIVECSLVDTDFGTVLKISDEYGNEFKQNLDTWGQGAAFFYNNTSSSMDVSLSFMPRDIDKKIWVFGDSYFDFFPPYLYELGFSKWLRNSQPGDSPNVGFEELKNLLSLGFVPKYVLWCLGMNGDTNESKDGDSWVINKYQKTYVDAVKKLCEDNNIIPVFVCVPPVPTRQKTGYREYIKSLGVRYVDIYDAVGTNESGVWTTGLISDDGVHPNRERGGKVIADRFVSDFPEITICE